MYLNELSVGRTYHLCTYTVHVCFLVPLFSRNQQLLRRESFSSLFIVMIKFIQVHSCYWIFYSCVGNICIIFIIIFIDRTVTIFGNYRRRGDDSNADRWVAWYDTTNSRHGRLENVQKSSSRWRSCGNPPKYSAWNITHSTYLLYDSPTELRTSQLVRLNCIASGCIGYIRLSQSQKQCIYVR
jgi:hypothetical protein